MLFNPEGKEHLRMTNSETIYKYLHGGKGEVTLVNPNTWKGHTFAFLHPRTPEEFPEDTIFVYVKHESHKYYLGKLREEDGLFMTTSGTKFEEDTDSVRGAKYIAKMSLYQELVDKNAMYLYSSGRCCKCGRKLSRDESIECGFGKKCASKFEKSAYRGIWDGNF